MKITKMDCTLNEKDTLQDMLESEKQLMEQLGETEQTILGPVHISPHVRIFEQILAGCEAKICRRTGVRQKFLTMQATKFAEKTCAWAYANRP